MDKAFRDQFSALGSIYLARAREYFAVPHTEWISEIDALKIIVLYLAERQTAQEPII